jgi:hypothetical protein
MGLKYEIVSFLILSIGLSSAQTVKGKQRAENKEIRAKSWIRKAQNIVRRDFPESR